MEEKWKPVVDFEGAYEVSDYGRIRSLDRIVKCRGGAEKVNRGRIKKLSTNCGGYPIVNLCKMGRCKVFFLHVLILESFVGPRPEGYQACHRDGVRANSTLVNLRWGSVSSNFLDRVTHGTDFAGERNPQAKITNVQAHEVKFADGYQKDIAARYGITQQTVSDIKRGRIRKSHLP